MHRFYNSNFVFFFFFTGALRKPDTPQVRNLSWTLLLPIILFIEAMDLSFHPRKTVFREFIYGWAPLHLSFLKQISLYFSDLKRENSPEEIENSVMVMANLLLKITFLFEKKILKNPVWWLSFGFLRLSYIAL